MLAVNSNPNSDSPDYLDTETSNPTNPPDINSDTITNTDVTEDDRVRYCTVGVDDCTDDFIRAMKEQDSPK